MNRPPLMRVMITSRTGSPQRSKDSSPVTVGGGPAPGGRVLAVGGVPAGDDQPAGHGAGLPQEEDALVRIRRQEDRLRPVVDRALPVPGEVLLAVAEGAPPGGGGAL